MMPHRNTVRNPWLSMLAPALVIPGLALGSGQYEVEDAELIDRQSCETELWHNDALEAQFMNTLCRGQGMHQTNLEIEMPRFDRELFALEHKWLWRDLGESNFGVGLYGGAIYATEGDRFEEFFVTVPLSFHLVPERATAHLNLGALHERGSEDQDDDTIPTWGLGTEIGLLGPVSGIAEVFGDDRDDPTVQAGLRATVFSEQLVLDLSYLEELESGGANGWAAGVTLIPIRF